jgi:hypothetical protein
MNAVTTSLLWPISRAAHRRKQRLGFTSLAELLANRGLLTLY